VLEVRTLTDDDMPALQALDEWAFGSWFPDDRFAVSAQRLERPRQRGAFVDGTLVGHVAAFSHRLTLPGGLVPAAGVTWVGVSPQVRRRGIAARLLNEQLVDLAADGEPVATLWASEAGIYGRFGYGVASRRAAVDVPRGAALDGPGAEHDGLALGNASDLLEDAREAYERLRPTLPGMITREDADWQAAVHDDERSRTDASPLRAVVVRDHDGAASGYAFFRTKVTWGDGRPSGTVSVDEALAATPAAARGVLDVLLNIDLTTTVSFWNLPVDHPVFTFTRHTVGLAPRINDQLWVRLVRLADALRARRYSADVDVVLEVTDATLPDNAGRWRLAAGTDGCQVERTQATPDVSLDVRDLAAAYLGDTTLAPAAVAGVVTEHTSGAVGALARAMQGSRAPYCAYMF
jgi:predicted acetyltransferase